MRRRHAEYFCKVVVDAGWPANELETAWADGLQTEEGNLRAAIDWSIAHDITPLPHLFRILWLYWALRDQMADGLAWIDQILPQLDSLDDHARAELLVMVGATATEVGDDEKSLAAAAGIRRLGGRIDDPFLQGAAQLVQSWILPLDGDLDGALQAASSALDGFRQQGQLYMTATAAMSTGMLESMSGRSDSARRHLAEVYDLGRKSGTDWLMANARVQLAALAVRAGRHDEARALLNEIVEASVLSARTLTFHLVTYAELAVADGDATHAALALGAAEGLRQRAGLWVWPAVRRSEGELRASVQQALDPNQFDEAFTEGSQLTRQAVVAFLRRGI